MEVLHSDLQTYGEAGDGLLLDGVEIKGLAHTHGLEVVLDPVARRVGVTEERDGIGIVHPDRRIACLGDLHIDEATTRDTGYGDALEVRTVGEGAEGPLIRGTALLGDVDSAIAAREAEERKQGEACGDLAYHHCLLDEVVGTSLGWGLDLAQQALQ